MARIVPIAPVVTQDGDRQLVKVPVARGASVAYDPRVAHAVDGYQWVFPPIAPTGR